MERQTGSTNKVGEIVNISKEQIVEEDIAAQPILELSATAQLSDYVSAIAWSPSGNILAAACCNGEVHLLKNFVRIVLCPPTGNAIDALAFSFDGKWLAAGGLDGNISLWRIDREVPELVDPNAQAHPLRVVETGSWIDRLVWSPTCNHLAFNQGKTVQIWDVDRAEAVTNLAAATRELVTVWVKTPLDWNSWVLELSSGNVIDLAFQPKSGVLASLAEDGWIVLWQAAVEAVQVLDGAEEGFCCLGWHPTGCRLAAGGRRGELFIWSVCG